MSVWAIVPIKPLNRAKSRLAAVLDADERAKLATKMLHHNLKVLTECPLVAGVLVISRDMKALAEARSVSGVQTLQESGAPELNNALRRATAMLISWKVGATLILPADTPLVSQDDVEAIIELGRAHHTIVIAPDRKRDGTNAILGRPPDVIPFEFGIGSFERHQQEARQVGAEVKIYESERLSVDVDTPEDLAHYAAVADKLGEETIISIEK